MKEMTFSQSRKTNPIQTQTNPISPTPKGVKQKSDAGCQRSDICLLPSVFCLLSMVMREKSIFVIIIGVLLNIQTFAANWPQWRGPNRDGVWREKGIVQKFEGRQLPIRWRVKIANG